MSDSIDWLDWDDEQDDEPEECHCMCWPHYHTECYYGEDEYLWNASINGSTEHRRRRHGR
jgi:hypothetical protein